MFFDVARKGLEVHGAPAAAEELVATGSEVHGLTGAPAAAEEGCRL